ncbi:MAG TPA: FtsX-like permease family protein [Natronosporangium sp.]
MIALVLAQLAARWGQAVTLFALSLAATVATVGVPAYVDTVDQAAVRNELANASPAERILALPSIQAGPGEASGRIDPYDAARAQLPLLEPVTTVQIRVRGLRADAPAAESHLLIARDGFCQRVVYRSGRCPVGNRELALPQDLAEFAELAPGAVLRLTPVVATDFGLQPDGPEATWTVVGVFDPIDPADPYWRTGQDPLGLFSNPSVFTTRTAIETTVHQAEIVHLDAVLPDGRLTADQVPELRAQLERTEQRVREEDPTGGPITTGLPRLLDRISGHGDQARALLPIAAAPLVALCWFVVYLAVGHAAAARRHEFGIVALRGARLWTRAAAIATECLLPVLAAAPIGLLAANLLVDLVGPGTAAAQVDAGQWRSAGLAAAGTALAALLAVRREVAAPVAQLLRRVPPRRRAAVATAEVIVVVLAIVAVVELHGLDGELSGVMVAAPAAVMLAVAVVAARAVRPISTLAGRWALRRGWLGPSLAALALARRPGATRLVIVLALVLGLLGFALTSAEVAAAGRAAEARRALGAVRVLDVEDVERGRLLQAVRAADPSGRYAMAVVIASGRSEDPPVVAVDATRLAEVALWPAQTGAGCEPDQPRCRGTDPAAVAEALRPPAPEPVVVRNGELVAELGLSELTPERTVILSLLLSPPAGIPQVVSFGPVGSDQSTYRAEVTGCPDGCRLTGVAIASNQLPPDEGIGEAPSRIDVRLRGLSQAGAPVGPTGWLADQRRWRQPERGRIGEFAQVAVGEAGVSFAQNGVEVGVSYPALAVDVPYPLPVAVAGDLPDGELVTSIDHQLIRVAPQVRLAGVPGAGAHGVLMDLEYADRLATDPGIASQPQVWLAPDAPPQVIDALHAQGLVVSDDRTLADVQAAGEGSGAALALRYFLLAAGLAVLVGLVALGLVVTVDRRTWRRALRRLRAHGLAERTVSAADLWSYGGVVLVGAVTGLLAAGAAWVATGARLPLGVDETVLEFRPEWRAVAPVWLVVVALLLAAAVVAARWRRQRREVGD